MDLDGRRGFAGLPVTPHYDLGVMVGSPCDTLSVEMPDEVIRQPEMNLSPIPISMTLYFNAHGLQDNKGILYIYNLWGVEVYRDILKIYSGGNTTKDIDMRGFTPGVYFISFEGATQRVSGRFVKK